VVKGNGKFIPQAVKFWVECYEKDPKPAMVDLLTMLFEVIIWNSQPVTKFKRPLAIDIIVSYKNQKRKGRLKKKTGKLYYFINAQKHPHCFMNSNR